MADAQLTEEQIRRQIKMNTYRRINGANRYYKSYKQRIHESLDEDDRDELTDIRDALADALDNLQGILETLYERFDYTCTAWCNGTVNAFEDEMDSLLEEIQSDLDVYEDDVGEE